MSSKMSSKEKVLGKLSKWDKQRQSVYLGVNIENKIIDGVKKTIFSCSDNSVCGPSDKVPLKKEFTSKESFVEFLESLIESIDKQL